MPFGCRSGGLTVAEGRPRFYPVAAFFSFIEHILSQLHQIEDSSRSVICHELLPGQKKTHTLKSGQGVRVTNNGGVLISKPSHWLLRYRHAMQLYIGLWYEHQ